MADDKDCVKQGGVMADDKDCVNSMAVSIKTDDKDFVKQGGVIKPQYGSVH